MTVQEKHLVSPEARAQINNPTAFTQKIEEGATTQELLGFSDEAVMDFYDAACSLLDQKEYKKAADAFFFLAHLAPQVKAFWLGMARSERLNKNTKAAVGWYVNAILIDQSDTDLYMECVRCCIGGKCYEEAVAVLNLALAYAQDHPDEEGMTELHDVAIQGKEWLLSQPQGES